MDTSNLTINQSFKTIDSYDFVFQGAIYGHQGSGKTTLASTFPRPLKWLDYEKSSDALRGLPKEVRDQIDIERVRNMAQSDKAVEAAVKNTSPYKTIVVDTANTLQGKQLGEYMIELVKKPANAHRDVNLPAQLDFRISTSRLNNMFKLLQDCDKNVIVLIQEREIWDTSNKDGSPPRLVGVRPDLTQRLASLMEQLLSNVLYLELKPSFSGGEHKRLLHFTPGAKFFAKNRLGYQGKPIENPTYDKIMETINHE